MEKCDKCGEFIEFAQLCPLCAHYEKEHLKQSAKKCEERARKVEKLARELVDMLRRVSPRYLEGRIELDLDLVHETNGLLERAEEVLGDEETCAGRPPPCGVQVSARSTINMEAHLYSLEELEEIGEMYREVLDDEA